MEQPTRIRAEEIEEALAQVAEIKAARVVSSAEGVIQEIHVLALPSKAPKQLVRDIESTIMARVRHSYRPQEDLDRSARPRGRRARTVRATVGAAEDRLHQLQCRGRADNRGRDARDRRYGVRGTLRGTEQPDRSPASGCRSHARRDRAVHGDGGHIFALEDVSIVQLGKEQVAVACVTLVIHPRRAVIRRVGAGQAEREGLNRSATLDAINRRMGFLTT